MVQNSTIAFRCSVYAVRRDNPSRCGDGDRVFKVHTAQFMARSVQVRLHEGKAKFHEFSDFLGCFSSCGPYQAFLLAPGQHDRGQRKLRVGVRSLVNKGRQILQPGHVCALISGPLSTGVIASEGNQGAFTPSVSNRDGEAVASDAVLRPVGKECEHPSQILHLPIFGDPASCPPFRQSMVVQLPLESARS